MNCHHFSCCLGMLHRREIDIAPQDFSVTKDRASVVDYLPGVTPTYTQIFIRNPDALPNWMAYIEPLDTSCWLAILVVVILVPVLLYGISYLGNSIRQTTQERFFCRIIIRLTNAIRVFKIKLNLPFETRLDIL